MMILLELRDDRPGHRPHESAHRSKRLGNTWPRPLSASVVCSRRRSCTAISLNPLNSRNALSPEDDCACSVLENCNGYAQMMAFEPDDDSTQQDRNPNIPNEDK